MKKNAKVIYGILSFSTMLIIILDSKCAVSSISGGINLCLETVIPALFPFFILSGILNSCFLGLSFAFMAPLRRFCKIPDGIESILLIGLISGYPVGARLATEAYETGCITKESARRMLGFCSNAGPAFLFGMLAGVFTQKITPWILWGIHIISSLIVAHILPWGTQEKCTLPQRDKISINDALHNAIRNIATVCGWVIVFRVVLAFFKKWFLWIFPLELQVLISGLIEISNGCILLQQIQNEGMRFIIASAILAFGGLCVAMQTVSVTGKLGTGYYFPGKFLQTVISIVISCFVHPFLFGENNASNIYLYLLIFLAFLFICLLRKIVVAFGRRMLYNINNKCI